MKRLSILSGLIMAIVACFLLSDRAAESQVGAKPPRSYEMNLLLQARRETLQELVDTTKRDFDRGLVKFDAVQNAREALYAADLELAKNKDERVQLLAQRVADAAEFEKKVEQKYLFGNIGGSHANYLSAKAMRQTAEIQLMEAKAAP